MPNKVVTVHRWQAVGVLVLLTLAYVVAVFLVNRESEQRSSDNRELIVAQAKQRAELTYIGCLDQNERHDATISRLDTILAAAIKNDPSREQALRATRSSTVFLIEALAPHQNCKQIVLDRFGFIPTLPESVGDGNE